MSLPPSTSETARASASTLESKLTKQLASKRLIERFWENLMKIGKEKVTSTYLNARLHLLEDYWQKFENGHFALLDLEDAQKTEYMMEDLYCDTESAYIEVKTRIWDALQVAPAVPAPTSPGPVQGRQLPLPRISLPTFSGDQLAWEGFRDLFRALVHDVPDIAAVQKLQYLKMSLTGEAAAVVANTELSESGYRVAWEDLIARYDNKRVLLSAHMRALLTSPPVTTASSSDIKRLVSAVNHAVRSFRSLKRPVDAWDDWFVHILVDKLDSATRLLWEASLSNSTDFPKLTELLDFLLTRARALDAAGHSQPAPARAPSPTRPARGRQVAALASTASPNALSGKCSLCQGAHAYNYCARFRSMSVSQRRELVRRKGACFNCLKSGHDAAHCPSAYRCQRCQERHHSFLHPDAPGGGGPTPPAGSSLSPEVQPGPATAAQLTSHVTALSTAADRTVLLATARVLLKGLDGRTLTVRALLDSGSEASFVSDRVAQVLGLARRRVSVPITGLQGANTGTASHAVTVSIAASGCPSWSAELPRALVLGKLTSRVPAVRAALQSWPHLEGLPLADPDFRVPAPVEAILGADIYGRVLLGGVVQGPQGTPSAQLTVFGWVLMGAASPPSREPASPPSVVAHHALAGPDLDRVLQRFWEMEEFSSASIPTPEDARCEEHYAATHRREQSGRYVVRLPRREGGVIELGESRAPCVRMLLSLEARLGRNATLRPRYSAFLADYLEQGHMQRVPADGGGGDAVSYLPHHPVVKEGDPAGKIRVVFNASFCTSSGHSLNDLLLSGPRLQSDLWVVITRWRLFRHVFTADIVQMFRQIRMHPEDCDLQRIVWRDKPDGPVDDFRLTTVTYGTASAPYLALRTLLQLAEDERARFPLGAAVIESHSYVDDLLAGADSLPQALEVRRQLTGILMAGGFPLSKWAANDNKLCPGEGSQLRLLPTEDAFCTLGVLWSPTTDTFHLRPVAGLSVRSDVTKRSVLSDVARFFDPLGWAAPVLIAAKILIQELWIAGVAWDESLTPELRAKWSLFAASLTHLEDVRIPRWLQCASEGYVIELHGFSDASSRAYAAAVYLRSTGPTGVTTVSLLVAKTKVAPVKTVSIPRLELCAAVLLARLLDAVATGLRLVEAPRYGWTDAEVVLAWIASHPSRWKPYVANRIATLQELLPPSRWRHVPTADNPADVATRGIPAAELAALDRWWSGPTWLARPPAEWPVSSAPDGIDDGIEEETPSTSLTVSLPPECEFLSRYSSLARLLRITALCRRFAHNTRHRAERRTGFLKAEELEAARLVWVRQSQEQDFPEELKALACNRPLARGSALLPLRPFRGPDGLLRVGGRLQHSSLTYDERSPLILAKTSRLALLLAREAHLRTLHGGPTLTRNILVRRYWVIHAGSLVRSVVHKCVRCARFRAAASQQMGQLPASRTQPGRPFEISGVDYAGPLQLRTTKGRGHKSYKGYICLFVCFASKAVHLEAVSDLTSASFLAAFRRFVARRGPCRRLVSDNGTAFRGADVELRAMFRAASAFYNEVGASLAGDGTDWEFIPPAAPHFGGLWEAGVKAVKHHLRRVIGDSTLTFEELTTFLCEVEACLNSRPLAPLSNDPTDLAALTPGHLLVGEPLVGVPEPPGTDNTPRHALSRWAQLSRMRDHFWHRWRTEYLHHLQQLSKWRRKSDNVRLGDLVLIKSEVLPPTKWPLARVLELHPGSDGLVRVVTLKTSSGSLKRPVAKLCVLPVESSPRQSGSH